MCVFIVPRKSQAHKLHSSLSNYNCLLKMTINITSISPERKQLSRIFQSPTWIIYLKQTDC